jgi:hypothetical protein
MKIPRKLLLFTLIAVAVAIGGLVQTFNVIVGKNRAFVEQELQKVFGKDLHYDGLEVSLLPRPGFSAREIRIADDPRFAATPIVRAKELILGISLWNLLWGRIVIDSLGFSEPELQIITDEAGRLNLTTLSERKKELRSFPRFHSTAPERRPSVVSFAIGEIRVRSGRVEYLDRSVQAPAELHIKNIELAIRGFSPNEATRIRLAAALTEGLSQDVRIDGEIAPQATGASWSQRSVTFAIHFDSLHVPVIAGAIASLRDRIPRALDVTGPMALQANVSGTIERPRVDDFTLKAPLFGSSDYNAIATGAIDFTERGSWSAAQLQGRLNVKTVDLERLRNLPFLQQLLSPAVVTEGGVSFFSRFEGTWNTLRIGALLVADKGDIRYRDWLRKPANTPAEVRAKISRQKHRFLFHESELVVGRSKTNFSGSLETEPAPHLRLLLHGEQSSLAGWNQFLPPSEFLATAGRADWRLVVDKGLLPNDDRWSVHGDVKLGDAEVKHKVSGRKIEKLTGQFLFLGKQARLDNVAFRIGSSLFSLSGTVPDLLQPRLAYQLRSPRLNLADLPALETTSGLHLTNATGKGQLQMENSRILLAGSFAAPEGSFQRFNFRDFRSDILWSATGLAFDDLSLKIFKGTLLSEGRWTIAGDNSRRLRFTWRADAIDTSLLIGQLIPRLKNRLEGRLSGRAQFDAAAGPGASLRDALGGDGETAVDRGVIRHFNLLRQLLLGGGDPDGSAETIARLPPSIAGLLNHRDTPFDSLKASFILEQKRIRTENLVMTTPDYTITGAGWMGLDRSTRWNGLIVLSPRVTQEIQRDYRMFRYLLDRRGRLAISFRLEGTIPNVKIRLDNRPLAQLLRSGAPPGDRESDNQSGEATREGKAWLPDALERFLNR